MQLFMRLSPWYVALTAATLLGCGTSPDSRPLTFEYITLEVLAPACGTVACHSSTTRDHGYAFDELSDARTSLTQLVTKGDPARSRLYDVITSSNSIMPPDAPLASEDIALIKSWIAAGAPGL